jgi:hypothetical protein
MRCSKPSAVSQTGCLIPRPRSTGCRSDEELVQDLPASGSLAGQLNLSIADLNKSIRAADEEATAYIYVVNSAKWNLNLGIVEHSGSGPNFQGGRVTLCTCKRSMRAGRRAAAWPGTWIAGLTSGDRGPQALFYLMRVEYACESHYELWHYLPENVRRAKSMRRSAHGDICEPRDMVRMENRESLFGPQNYYAPCANHSHRDGWKNDLDFRIHDAHGRHAPLLVGHPEFSYFWSKPVLARRQNLSKQTQGCKKLSIAEFLESLEPLR